MSCTDVVECTGDLYEVLEYCGIPVIHNYSARPLHDIIRDMFTAWMRSTDKAKSRMLAEALDYLSRDEGVIFTSGETAAMEHVRSMEPDLRNEQPEIRDAELVEFLNSFRITGGDVL